MHAPEKPVQTGTGYCKCTKVDVGCSKTSTKPVASINHWAQSTLPSPKQLALTVCGLGDVHQAFNKPLQLNHFIARRQPWLQYFVLFLQNGDETSVDGEARVSKTRRIFGLWVLFYVLSDWRNETYYTYLNITKHFALLQLKTKNRDILEAEIEKQQSVV